MKLVSKKSPPIQRNGEQVKGNTSCNEQQYKDDVNISQTCETMNEKQPNATRTSDQKRLNSLLEMKKLYRQKKNTVKIALTNVVSILKQIFTFYLYIKFAGCTPK